MIFINWFIVTLVSHSFDIITIIICKRGGSMQRLLIGILLFSLWLYTFGQGIDSTSSNGIDQDMILSH